MLRPELEPLPARMNRLPVDARGYPVPWFVAWMDDGTPDFRIMDRAKWALAVRERRCWLCGDRLGAYLVFVIGPMCGVNRTTAEPPCHRECAQYAVRNCPFLARPHMVRREDAVADGLAESPGGVMLDRNPGVALLWTTKRYSVFDDGHGKPLIHLGDPVDTQWFSGGRPASRAEVIASIAGGLPTLRELAEAQDREEGAGAVAALERMTRAFERFYPAA